MDLAEVEDITLLKALAYEQICVRDTADSNLRKIEIRISELERTAAQADTQKSSFPESQHGDEPESASGES